MRSIPRLSAPRLGAPTDPLVAVFRAVEKVLRTDPAFSAACQTFLAWTGTALDAADIELGFCPFCRISPAPVASDMATEIQHRMPIAITVELAVAGTDFDNLGNFWGLIRNALWPVGDDARRALVQSNLMAAGVTRPVIRQAAFGSAGDRADGFLLVGLGTIQFNSLVMTP